jgi:prolyl-tRNA synthetase
VAKGSVVLARRDRPGKEGKSFVPQEGIAQAVTKLLEEIQKSIFDRALAFRKANTFEPADYAEFRKAVEKGFAFSWWCGSGDCEAKIKEETKATMRCIPLDQTLGEGRAAESGSGKCIYCGQLAKEKGIFARAY